MANVEVYVKGSVLKESAAVRALVANNSPVTQISRRFAQQLGLTQFRSIYVSDSLGIGGDACCKWKLSLCPIIITVPSMNNKIFVSYPVVNGNEDDAFFEMIIGQDCQKQSIDILNIAMRNYRTPATGGPSFSTEVHFMGHNVKLADDENLPRNEFYDYPCLDSKAVQRIAINKFTRKLVVIHTGADTVYEYRQLPGDLERLIEQGASRGETMQRVKQMCRMTILEAFPDAAQRGADVKMV